ncbi:Pex16 family peroxisome import protein [Schizosaccharomyces japonicus yFS275]|uniref:Peroxisomal membrane protein PEX16 n=1 Tax=Schizosaccharomyces japonicus (strain yFS275 / FY16936) TaxID=402676 RepID=B6K487_SCHJY|nr:Pex16 family peroxisome import protein [Schizosaccharomyces japonicus yFS275]EEB08294.1 Pex16 family peroxisome import protein [Schizosaccharomyces japonicus yFS275]
MLEKYEKLLVLDGSGEDRIAEIEKILSGLLFILPCRFRKERVVSEAVYALLLFLKHYHNQVIYKYIKTLPKHVQRKITTPYAQVIKHFQAKYASYKPVSDMLFVLQTSSFPAELFVARTSPESQEDFVLVVEATKALLRLYIMYLTSGRLPLPSNVLGRDFNRKLFAECMKQYTLASSVTTLPRTGKQLPQLSTVQSPSQHVRTHVTEYKCLVPTSKLFPKPNRWQQLANTIKVLRPFVYVVLERYWRRFRGSHGRKHSWVPWLIALTLELSARAIHISQTGKNKAYSYVKTLQDQVYATSFRRFLNWAMLQGRYFDQFTSKIITFCALWLGRLPLLGSLIRSALVDFVQTCQDFYFFISNY